MKKTNVDALLLSLASAGLIEIQRVHNEDRWNVARTSPSNLQAGTPLYMNDDAWSGINLHDERRKRVRNPNELLAKPTTEEDDDKSEDEDSDDGSDDDTDENDNE